MKTRRMLIALLPAAAAAFGPAAMAAEGAAGTKTLTVDEIVAGANHVAYYQGANGRALVKMTIVDAQKRTRQREMTILRWDAPDPAEKAGSAVAKKDEKFTGEQKFYIYFHKPADVDKMAFLVHKHLDRDDDRWMYLPKIDLVKRIAGGEKRTSFVGSDFFYEDVSGRNIKDDTHELLESTSKYYVLKSTPKDPRKVEFAYYKTWIHKTTFLVVKNEYYDRSAKPYRRYQASAVKQIQGYWTVTKARMDDLLTGRYTDVEYSDVKYDLDLGEDIFTERYLRRPPKEHLGT